MTRPPELRSDGASPAGSLSAGWKAAAAVLWVLLLAGKTLAASELALFGDEAYYWQCSRRLALAFADRPPLVSAVIRASCELLGSSTLAVRAPFLLVGAIFPFVLYRVARPVVGARDAWLAGAASLVFMPTASLGAMALPDVFQLLFGVLFLGAFERATRTRSKASWAAAGLLTALGFWTQYRFLLFPLSALAYLGCTRKGRAHWRTPGPWLAGALMVPGLIPFVYQNFVVEFGTAEHYLVERHQTFDLGEPLDQLGQLAAVVGPLLFVALMGTLWMLVRRGRRGDDRAALFAYFAALPLAFFFAWSPFESSGIPHYHWFLPGLLVLLVHLPAALSAFVRARPTRLRRVLVALVPATACAEVLLGVLVLSTGWPGVPGVRRPFLGWNEVAACVRTRLAEGMEGGAEPVLVADNYKLAGNLEFQLRPAELFVLTHEKNRAHGRQPQFRIWNMDEAALSRRGPAPALLVVQESEHGERALAEWMVHVESFFDTLEPLDEVVVETAKRNDPLRFRVYRGRLKGPEESP